MIKEARPNLVVLGGGIIGITIARQAALSKAFQKIIVIEKEKKFGIHSSTRNSGVIHSGFYYAPNSKRARLCADGNKLLREYCLTNSIMVRKCGKVVVTENEDQEEVLFDLFNRGIYNNCEVKILPKEKLSLYEKYAKTFKNFLWSPNTWSTSPIDLFKCLLHECNDLGIELKGDTRMNVASDKFIKTTSGETIYYDYLVNATGGYALEVAKNFGVSTNYKILPFKGLYLKSTKRIDYFKRHIYPVPNVNQTFLGIHTTLTSDGYLKLGPTAIPALSPENYRLFEGLDLHLTPEIINLQLRLLLNNSFGFRDLAFKEVQYLLKQNIINQASKLTGFDLNQIDYKWHSPGIRAQLYNQKTKNLENDFVLSRKDNSFHLLNSISPAWTCSLMTAKEVILNLQNCI